MDLPTLTCIMPTRNRRMFVAQAIQYFLRQDYPSKELLVLDDGETRADDLVSGHPEIRYVRLNGQLGIYEKRRRGLEIANSELVAHWDDDDWSSPNRLRVQATRLLESSADACALGEVWHYDLSTARGWLFQQPEISYSDGTLMYWRRAGAPNRFDRICRLESSGLYVGLIHGANAALPSFADPCWRKCALQDVLQWIEPDRDFYSQLRAGLTGTAAQRDSLPPITLAAHFDVSTGYGSMAEYLALGMARCGADVRLLPLSLRPQGLTEEFLRLPRSAHPDRDTPAIYYCWPRPELDRFSRCRNLFINTMWESDVLPPGWAAALNRARTVFAPSRFVADTFRNSGVTAPVEIIPEGIDPEVYHFINRPERSGVTTLIVGPIDGRKHVPEGIAAWKKAFAGDPDARLIIKTNYGYHNYRPDDPRIQYIDRVETTRGISHWYREADVLLALGSEGFGLPLLEGMATGLPVIALNAEGQADVCSEARDLLLPVRSGSYAEARDPIFGDCGKRSVPDIDDAAAKLKWVAEHRDESRQMGRTASRWAIANRSAWSKAAAMLEIMEHRCEAPRPLRREIPVWTPSEGKTCGVAEYTADLAAALPSARVSRVWPASRSTPLVHIQHEYSLLSGSDMERRIREAHLAGRKIAVTQHTVTAHASAWQAEADALVALTSSGAAQLRSMFPAKRVEHIPHGCHCWFLPRKVKRGKVIGLFGFLETYKGFFAVLDALRELPGCEVLALNHAKNAALESGWESRAAGLPVRRIKDFLPADEIARRLAADADVLVFWYDEPPFFAASGAASIGLATGVPVLASRTKWFSDLRDCTLQPENLIDGIAQLLDDTDLRDRLQTAAREHCMTNSWQGTAGRHLELWRSMREA